MHPLCLQDPAPAPRGSTTHMGAQHADPGEPSLGDVAPADVAKGVNERKKASAARGWGGWADPGAKGAAQRSHACQVPVAATAGGQAGRQQQVPAREPRQRGCSWHCGCSERKRAHLGQRVAGYFTPTEEKRCLQPSHSHHRLVACTHTHTHTWGGGCGGGNGGCPLPEEMQEVPPTPLTTTRTLLPHLHTLPPPQTPPPPPRPCCLLTCTLSTA